MNPYNWYTLEVIPDVADPTKFHAMLHHPVSEEVDHHVFSQGETIELSFRDMVEFRVGESS
jgi:hypothetical protein